MARPCHAPTTEGRDLVRLYASVGVPQDHIALKMGVDGKTLRKWYREELDLGTADANAAVGKTLFNLAVGGNVAACIFWMKARAGWSERVMLGHLTDEQLIAEAKGIVSGTGVEALPGGDGGE